MIKALTTEKSYNLYLEVCLDSLKLALQAVLYLYLEEYQELKEILTN